MRPEPLRVLLVQEDTLPAMTIQKILSLEAGRPFEVDWVRTLGEGIQKHDTERYDAIILDMSLPDSSGIKTFERMNRRAPETPIVIVTEAKHADLANAAVKAGAQDYLIQEPLDGSQLVRALGYAIERKHAQAELARLASFPEMDPKPIVELREDAALSYANPAARKLFPDLEKLGGAHPLVGNAEALVEQLLRGSEEFLIQKRNLDDRAYAIRVHFARTARLIRLYVADITDYEKVEEMKEEFLHHVSHELRSPLSAINQSVQLLLQSAVGEINEQQEKFLKIAERNASHLREMIEDLLEVTKAQTGKMVIEPRRMELGTLAEEVASDKRLRGEEKGITVKAVVGERLPPAFADPVRTRQVFINLVDNALKFIPKGSTVEVRVAVEDDTALRCSVVDDGPGIETAAAKRIFDKLYQIKGGKTVDGKGKGLGLGLFICREIVTRQGGRIRLDTKPGEGCSFSFTVPAFGLAKALEPLASQKGGALRLIRIELFPPSHLLAGNASGSLFNEAREILLRNVHADDVLLPEMSPVGGEGLFFVATAASAEVAEKVAKKLRGRLADHPQMQLNRVEPRAEADALLVPRENAEASAAAMADAVTRAVDAAFRERADASTG
jgi:signal transduction histidine kinase